MSGFGKIPQATNLSGSRNASCSIAAGGHCPSIRSGEQTNSRSQFGVRRGHTKLGRPPWCFLPIWIRCCMLPSDDGGKDGTFDGRRGTNDSAATREAMTQYDPTGTSHTSAPCCSNTSLTHT